MLKCLARLQNHVGFTNRKETGNAKQNQASKYIIRNEFYATGTKTLYYMPLLIRDTHTKKKNKQTLVAFYTLTMANNKLIKY